jgi:hypothetical protein
MRERRVVGRLLSRGAMVIFYSLILAGQQRAEAERDLLLLVSAPWLLLLPRPVSFGNNIQSKK